MRLLLLGAHDGLLDTAVNLPFESAQAEAVSLSLLDERR